MGQGGHALDSIVGYTFSHVRRSSARKYNSAYKTPEYALHALRTEGEHAGDSRE